ELSFNLIRYINHNQQLDEEVSSVIQVITLLGREKLTRWLLMYLYAENSKRFINESLLEMALDRAEHMESMANQIDKDSAFMTGMFSLLDILFDAEFDDIFQRIKIDTAIVEAITEKKGKYGAMLKKAEGSQKGFLKKIFIENFYQFDTSDLIDFLRNYEIDIKTDFE
ncbi:MAG: EAL and modified HD-GYP domain-containing signal transduction protein, partial [Sulfurimonas sp.]